MTTNENLNTAKNLIDTPQDNNSSIGNTFINTEEDRYELINTIKLAVEKNEHEYKKIRSSKNHKLEIKALKLIRDNLNYIDCIIEGFKSDNIDYLTNIKELRMKFEI